MHIDLDEDISSRPEHLDYRHEPELIQFERLYLQQRAQSLGNPDNNIVGLALSGGGIRSASFALGIMQAMARRDVLKQVDYLSTVSGGGYIGSSLSWFLSQPWDYGNGTPQQFGLGPEDFPFGTRANTHSEGPGAGSQDKMSILRHLRQNLNYLFPGDGINPMAFLAALVRGLFLNLLIYGPVLVFVLLSLAYLGGLLGIVEIESGPMENLKAFLPLAGAVFALTLIASLFYGLFCTFARSLSGFLYKLRRGYLKAIGMLLLVTAILLLIGSLPHAHHYLPVLFDDNGLLSSSGITLGGVLSGIWAYIRTGSSKEPAIKIPTGVIVTVSAALLLYGLLLLAYGTALKLPFLFNDGVTYQDFWLLIPIAVGLLINVNYITLHRYYRDRLMELFMPVPNKTTIDAPAQPAQKANATYLHEMCNYTAGAVGPYHLINANVVLPGSRITKFRGRGGDNFLLSPLYCGSNATGWMRTDRFIKGKFSFPTAMAVSGAAVNPNTGSDGEGPTRNPLLSAIMGFLNLRLGLWVENPNPASTCKYFRPNMWVPGLWDMLLPKRMHEHSKFIELSDGGHFENLAAYELIRRESDLIILADGAADEGFKFTDFANLVEKVRLDFGALIEINLDPLIPKSGKDLPYGLEKIASRGHTIGKIRYRSNKIGFLVYVKTTLVPDLPADIYGYKLTHTHFPDESTGDQFFDEKQFEAYRELGYQLGSRMLDSLPTYLEGILGHHAEHYEWLLIRFGLSQNKSG